MLIVLATFGTIGLIVAVATWRLRLVLRRGELIRRGVQDRVIALRTVHRLTVGTAPLTGSWLNLEPLGDRHPIARRLRVPISSVATIWLLDIAAWDSADLRRLLRAVFEQLPPDARFDPGAARLFTEAGCPIARDDGDDTNSDDGATDPADLGSGAARILVGVNTWGRRQAARVVVFDPHDRVLLIEGRDPARRGTAGWWEIPGGGIDPGEDTAEAVRRELWEEAGIRDADIGPCVWTQRVEYSFGGMHFDQDEWIHVARCDGTSSGPAGLEFLEAMAFGEQRWWAVEDVLDHGPRTIPYRMLEFLSDLATGSLPETPIDITPEDHHIEAWRNPAF